MARVVVDVMLKPEILDPQGQAVAGALHRLGFGGVTAVRQGKRFELEVAGEVDRRGARPDPRGRRHPAREPGDRGRRERDGRACVDPRGGERLMRVGVVTFPGSLDDRDALRAVRAAGGEAVALWHGDADLHGVDAVVLPGGFSYGDYLRCGAIARFAPVMEKVVDAAERRHAGPRHLQRLPDALRGAPAARARWCATTTAGSGAATRRCRSSARRPHGPRSTRLASEIVVPLKNGEGSYVADERTLDQLEGEGRVVARYVGGNPNGSYRDIAGVSNERGNVVGLMPHPEHATEQGFGPDPRSGTDGLDGLRVLHVAAGLARRGHRVSVDTVKSAEGTPDVEQPWAELGLKADEYQRIREILGRRPTSSELAMYSVMWSEHCSYKSSKVHLRQFGEKTTDAMRSKLMVGIGENAGVVDIGDGWAVTFKVESHNHPSYVEPYQGAATGVGGIVRDIMSMGARPIAVMDPLRFGAIDHPDTQRVLPGIVAGVGGYGNCLGLPNIGGEVVFDPCYQGNPLVNALCVGSMRHDDIHLANASGQGNLVVLFGAKTGGDGIGGVSVLASETFEATGPSKRPAVQVGDPFAEKVLIECCLDLFAARVVEGIQDLGGAGLSCATSELASNGDGGMHVVARPGSVARQRLAPEEILMSESQERMMAVVTPDKLDEFLAITAKWDVEATVVGEVTPPGGWSSSGTARSSSTSPHAPWRTTGRSTPGRCPVRPGWMRCRPTRRRPDDSSGRPPATRCGRRCCGWCRPQPVQQGLGDRPVRPLRAGEHGARHAGRRRCGARRREHRPRRRPVDGLQRPVRQPSTRTPGPSWRSPRPTATSRRSGPSRWRSPTASTSARPRTRTSCGSSPRP